MESVNLLDLKNQALGFLKEGTFAQAKKILSGIKLEDQKNLVLSCLLTETFWVTGKIKNVHRHERFKKNRVKLIAMCPKEILEATFAAIFQKAYQERIPCMVLAIREMNVCDTSSAPESKKLEIASKMRESDGLFSDERKKQDVQEESLIRGIVQRLEDAMQFP